MAVGTTTDYSDTAQTLIEDAMRSIGAIGIGQSATSDEIAYGLRVANRIVKSWQGKTSFNLWRTVEGSVSLVEGQAAYALAGKPLRVDEARYTYVDETILPMIRLSRQEYYDLPSRTSTGIPTNFYYDSQRETGTLFIWPVPAAVTTETIAYTYQRAFFDFDTSADNPDVPQEWLLALQAAVEANIFSSFFPTDTQGMLARKAEAERLFQEALAFDQEDAPIILKLETHRRV